MLSVIREFLGVPQWIETRIPASINVNIPSIGWMAGDAVTIRRLDLYKGKSSVAYVTHDRIGNSLNNVALCLLDFEEKFMLGDKWAPMDVERLSKSTQTPFPFNRINSH